MSCLFFVLPQIILVVYAYTNEDPLDNSVHYNEDIVGGENTTVNKHPYQLSVEVFGRPFCGASLIKPDVAVTAAHCTQGSKLYYNFGFLSVRGGTSRRGKGGEVIGVSDICTHPKYKRGDYDIAVLHLNNSFQLNDKIQTIEIQPKNAYIPIGKIATVSGFGTLKFRGTLSDVLQEVSVPRVSQVACRKAYPIRLTPRMICFGYKMGEKDACQGDSGGPLVLDGKLTGIVSFGNGCAQAGFPGIYANIANPEISEHIKSCIAKAKSR